MTSYSKEEEEYDKEEEEESSDENEKEYFDKNLEEGEEESDDEESDHAPARSRARSAEEDKDVRRGKDQTVFVSTNTLRSRVRTDRLKELDQLVPDLPHIVALQTLTGQGILAAGVHRLLCIAGNLFLSCRKVSFSSSSPALLLALLPPPLPFEAHLIWKK